ncbi:MAG TPA: hypothetical protein VH142_00580 [Polyangiaceae bacterium]|nr:hypothetical protein [Polyangiaceae bacterium]
MSTDHGESSNDDELAPDEPRTPLWLPLLGLGLFLAALIYALVGGSPSPKAPAADAPVGSASAAPAAPPAG